MVLRDWDLQRRYGKCKISSGPYVGTSRARLCRFSFGRHVVVFPSDMHAVALALQPSTLPKDPCVTSAECIKSGSRMDLRERS